MGRSLFHQPFKEVILLGKPYHPFQSPINALLSAGGTFLQKLARQFGCLIPVVWNSKVSPLITLNIVSFRPWRLTFIMLRFGQHLIKPSVVFLKTELSFALVNRKPVVPGRILSSSASTMGARALGKSRSSVYFKGQVGCDARLLWNQAVERNTLDRCCRTAENGCLATVTLEVNLYWPFHHRRCINNQVLLKAF